MATSQKLIFQNSEAVKNAIMDSQKKEIAELYEKWAEEIGKKADKYSKKTTPSSVVAERQMKELQKQLKATSHEVSNEIHSKIKKNMYTIADAVVADNVKWLESFGFSADGLNAAFSYVPDEIVRNLVTGQIYQGGWNLSSKIWGDNEATLKSTYQIVAKGLAENAPIYDIAKELEQYVSPSKQKNWNPVLAMKNTKTGKIEYKRIYKKQVDYNAQRLARTLVQHSYQQSFIAVTKDNPFVEDYIWHSNGSRVCPLCLARDKKHFKKDELPMDHPNGMCTMEPAVAEDMVDQLADWFNSPDGTFPEIDKFAGNFGYEVKEIGTIEDFIAKWGKSNKNPSAWYHSMTPIQKAEAKIFKDKEGLTWNKFYEKYLYSGNDSGIAKTTKKTTKNKVTVKVFNEAQEKYLKPYGYSVDNMPINFSEWSHKISHDEATEILTKMGTGWGHKHPYQVIEKYFKQNLTSSKFIEVDADDVAKVVTKKKTVKELGAVSKDNIDDYIQLANDNSKAFVELNKMFNKYGFELNDYLDDDGTILVDDYFFKKAKKKIIEAESIEGIGEISKDNFDDYITFLNKGNINAYNKLEKFFAKYGFDLDDFIDEVTDSIDIDDYFFNEAKKKIFGDKSKATTATKESFEAKYSKDKFKEIINDAYYNDDKTCIEIIEEFLDMQNLPKSNYMNIYGQYSPNKLKTVMDKFYGDVPKPKPAPKPIQKPVVSGSAPEHKEWFSIIKSQMEDDMLAKESDWMDRIGEKGISGIKAYTGHEYQTMNSYLRYLQQGYSEADAIAKSRITKVQIKKIKEAREGLKNVVLEEPLVLRRGSSIGDMAGLFMSGDYGTNKNMLMNMTAEELNDMFEGAVGTYGSFTSTSSLWDRGFPGYLETIIYAPPGTNASSIMSISKYGTGEGETLLNADTTVRCVKIEKSDGHHGSKIRMFVEIIPKI